MPHDVQSEYGTSEDKRVDVSRLLTKFPAFAPIAYDRLDGREDGACKFLSVSAPQILKGIGLGDQKADDLALIGIIDDQRADVVQQIGNDLYRLPRSECIDIRGDVDIGLCQIGNHILEDVFFA